MICVCVAMFQPWPFQCAALQSIVTRLVSCPWPLSAVPRANVWLSSREWKGMLEHCASLWQVYWELVVRFTARDSFLMLKSKVSKPNEFLQLCGSWLVCEGRVEWSWKKLLSSKEPVAMTTFFSKNFEEKERKEGKERNVGVQDVQDVQDRVSHYVASWKFWKHFSDPHHFDIIFIPLWWLTLVGYANIKLAVPRSFPIDMASVLMNVSFVNIDIAWVVVFINTCFSSLRLS